MFFNHIFLKFKSLYENTLNKHKQKIGQKFIDLNFNCLNVNASRLLDFKLNLKSEFDCSEKEKICKNYSVYGYCNVDACAKSHDIEIILRSDLMKKDKQNVQKLKALQENGQDEQICQDEILHTANKAHTAGLDAFMTGYIMLNYLNKFSKFELISQFAAGQYRLDQFLNMSDFNFNVYLSGKDYPLKIAKSNFATTSLNHQEKKQRTTLNLNN